MGEIVATRSALRRGQIEVPLDTRTKIVMLPDAAQREIVGRLFDGGRTFFWLDCAIEALRGVHLLAVRLAAGKDVLVVVHTDPLGDVNQSEKLSSERASIVAAWLEGDVDKWLDQFKESVPKRERWGPREDHHMLTALGGFDAVSDDERPEKPDARYDALVRGFQRSRGLEDDGIAGPVTRKQLIKEYFALAQVTETFEPVPAKGEAANTKAKLTKHGAGPHFSVADADAARERAGGSESGEGGEPGEPGVHARVDFFFFFNEEGIEPAPGRVDGEEFLQWVELSAEAHQRFSAAERPRKKAKMLASGGAHFRTGSAVLLPEGSKPTEDDEGAKAPLSSVGTLAVALRFNEERPGHKLLIAGHTDTVGSEKSNDLLSTERAELVHAVLMGDRDVFVSIARDSSTVADWKQILKWAAAAFPSVEELVSDEDPDADEDSGARSGSTSSGRSSTSSSESGEGKLGTGFSACDPGEVDDDEASGKPAVKAFQTAYNENYELLGGTGTITVDGKVGKQTWGAIFDLYQYNMAQELGEDFDGLKDLQQLVKFLPTKDPFVGFGESAPLDGSYEDNSDEQENRRVEVLFFEYGNEPEVATLDEDPKVSELYQEDTFQRVQLPPRRGGAKKHPKFRIRLLDVMGKAMTANDVGFSVRHEDELIAEGTADDGWAEFSVPPDGAAEVFVSWAKEGAASRFGRWVPLESASRADDEATARARLAALGYVAEPDNADDLAAMATYFQFDYGLGDKKIEPGALPASIKDHLRKAFRTDFEAPLPEPEDAEEEGESEPILQSEAGCQDDHDPFSDDLGGAILG